MSKKTLSISMALMLIALVFVSINKAYAELSSIPNPHQYKFASIGLPESLDPGWAYDTASGELIMNVYEPLIMYDHETTAAFIPILAKALPTVEKVTETLTNPTGVNKANPKGSSWNAGQYILFEWSAEQDKDESGTLTVGDVAWFENTADHEHSFQGVVKSVTGDPLITQLQVERVRVTFELRENVHFHPWAIDIPGYGDHTADLLTTEDVEFTFERDCVLDHEGGPMGLIMTPTLGIMTTREYDLTSVANQTAVGHMIDTAFASNSTHFWFNLVQTFPPFLQVITQSWGMIMNKAWIIALEAKYGYHTWAGFDGNYANWIDYTNPDKEEHAEDLGPNGGYMCGTGPYYFDFLELNDRWQIKKFDGYWGKWPGDPTSPFPEIKDRSPDLYIDTVIELDYSTDPTLAFPLFLSDDPEEQLDSCYVPRMNKPDLIGQPGVRTWGGMPQLVVLGFMMGYDPEETSPYLPEMPPGTTKHNLFSDIHIRKAFAHLVNHTKYIDVAFLGEAVWPNSIIIDGLKYHNADQALYDYDLTQALNEFKLAWGGSLDPGLEGPAYKQGFKFKLVYNKGNLMRETLAQMIETALEVEMAAMWPVGVNDNCVELLPLDWKTVILPALYTYQLVDWLVGWGADFPDPDNFARPYIHTLGDYSLFQRVQYGQSGMKQMAWNLAPWGLGTFGNPALTIDNDYVDKVIERAVLIDDTTSAGYNMREALYFHLQNIYYQECASFAAYQPAGRRWEREWVEGWYSNAIGPYGEGPGGFYYHMFKGWACHGDLDFRKDTVNGVASQNYLTCDYKDLAKFRGYYIMPFNIIGHRMRYADYDCNNAVDYKDLGRFRNYYIYYPGWALCEGVCNWHWPPPPY